MAKKSTATEVVADDGTQFSQEIQTSMAEVMAIKTHSGKDIFCFPWEKDLSVKRIDTGIPSLNFVLSNEYAGPYAGFPMGKIVSFQGKESSGKTAASATIAGKYLAAGKRVLWIDKEESFDPWHFKNAFNIDWENDRNFILAKPDSAEAAFDTVVSFVNNGAVDLVVLDSVAALMTEGTLHNNAEANSMATLARKMSEHLPRIITPAGLHNLSVLFVNQLRANISGGMAYGDKATGGNAMKYYPHVIVDFRSQKITAPDGTVIGIEMNITGSKNKTSRPYNKATLAIYASDGKISREKDILAVGEKFKIVTKSGAWINFLNEKIQGFDNARIFLMQNPDICEQLYQKILEATTAPIEPINNGMVNK